MNKRVTARFQPQAWIGDNAINIDGAFEFDVTEQIVAMGKEKALEIQDYDYDSDDLYHTYVEKHPEAQHNGPFNVMVAASIAKFFAD